MKDAVLAFQGTAQQEYGKGWRSSTYEKVSAGHIKSRPNYRVSCCIKDIKSSAYLYTIISALVSRVEKHNSTRLDQPIVFCFRGGEDSPRLHE